MSASRAAVLLALLAVPPAQAAPEPEAAPARLEAERYRSPGKPTAPLAIRYELAAEPVVGVPLTITVELEAGSELTGARLEARTAADGPLLLLARTPSSSPGGDALRWEIVVLPQREATGYVSLLASGLLAGEAQVRSFMIPVRFGAAKAAAAQVQAPAVEAVETREPGEPSAPGEERLIELPAVETTR